MYGRNLFPYSIYIIPLMRLYLLYCERFLKFSLVKVMYIATQQFPRTWNHADDVTTKFSQASDGFYIEDVFYFARKSKSAVIQVLTRVAPYCVRIVHLHNVQNIVVWHSDDARIAPRDFFTPRTRIIHAQIYTYGCNARTYSSHRV